MFFSNPLHDLLSAPSPKITLIKKRIEDKEITFAEAARTMSDEKETRANGGALINPQTLDPRFELTKMDPDLYVQVSDLREGQITQPIVDEDRLGRKTYKIITLLCYWQWHYTHRHFPKK